MTPELYRWNDDRLDDLAARVEQIAREYEHILNIRTELAEMRGQIKGVGGDTTECITELRALKTELQTRETTQRLERRADRRWMVGTLLTTAGLVIAALAIFLG